MTLDTGGPAFPRPTSDTPGQKGMTLRDWFAGQALTGLLANQCVRIDNTAANELDLNRIAADCYTLADAMLKVRKVEDPDTKPKADRLPSYSTWLEQVSKEYAKVAGKLIGGSPAPASGNIERDMIDLYNKNYSVEDAVQWLLD